jgi:hypothetical protein
VNFNLAIGFLLASSPVAVVVPNLLKVVFFAEPAGWRSPAFANGERDGDIRWEAVFMNLLPLDPFDISISGKWPAVESVEGRLTADVLWSGRSSWPELSRVDIYVNVDVLVDDRLAAVRSKCQICNLGRCAFLEYVVPPAWGLAKAIVFAETLPLHHRRPAPGAVFVEVDIAMIARPLVVLMEAIVVEIVSSASIPSSSAAAIEASRGWWWRRRRRTASSHALKSGAVPSLTTTTATAARGRRGIVIAVQIARGRAIHC